MSSDLTDPFEQLRLMRQSSTDRRQDLREIADAHVGLTASSILLTNQARLAERLIGADPNALVDVPADSTDANQDPGAGNGTPGPAVPGVNPTQPAAGATS